MKRALKFLFAILPAVLLVAAAAHAADAVTKYEIRAGEVVTSWEDKLVVKDANGVLTQYTIPAGQKFTVDGKDVMLADLKPGTKLGAIIETKTIPVVVTQETVKDGTVVKARGDRLVVKGEGGVKQYDIPAGFRFDVNGQKLRTEQLQAGMKLNATFITTTTGTKTEQKAVIAGSAPKPAAPAAAPAPAPAPAAAAAPAPAPAPAPVAVAEKPAKKKLPKTASPFPLAGLAGALSLASGLSLRIRRSR